MIMPRWGVSILALLIALVMPIVAFALMMFLQFFGTLVYLWGMIVEPHQIELTNLSVTSPHLPKNTE